MTNLETQRENLFSSHVLQYVVTLLFVENFCISVNL